MKRSHLLTFALALVLTCLAPSVAAADYGDLDASFGVGGKVRFGKDVSATLKALRIQPDGKVLISTDDGLFRLNRDGRRDKSFKARGTHGSPHDLELLGDGRIALISDGRYLTVLKPSGRLDPSFANAGTLKLGDGTTGFQGFSLAVQDGSKLLVSGTVDRSTTTTSLVRLNSDGRLDTTFGNAGTASVEGSPGGKYPHFGQDNGAAVAVNSAGEILLGIDRVPGAEDTGFAGGVAKLDRNGVRVSAFGVGGIAPIRIAGNYGISVANIAISASGNFIALGKGLFYGRGASIGYTTNYLNASGLPVVGGYSGYVISHREGVAATPTGFAFGSYFGTLHEDFSSDSRFDQSGIAGVSLGGCDLWGPIAADSGGALVITSSFEGCQHDEDEQRPAAQLTVVRLLGPSGGTAAPIVLIRSQVDETYERGWLGARWLKSISGVAGPVGSLRSVGVAIQRLDTKLLRRGSCRWLTQNGTKSIKTRAKNRRCIAPHFMPVPAGSEWKFTLRRPLPVGKYRIYARATLNTGKRTPFNKDPDNFRSFAVVKAR